MIDIETMSTSPTAAILQVGAVWFDLDATVPNGPTFERTVSLQSSVLAGLTIDPSTVAWWQRQSPEAQQAIDTNPEPLDRVLMALAYFVRSGLADLKPSDNKALIWANGIAFDIAVLENAYLALGLQIPWYFRNVRDHRTVLRIAEELVGWKRGGRPTAHTALADARAQVEDLQSAWAALRARARFDVRLETFGADPSGESAT